ncbi:MAG: hypothetical protein WBD95_19950, partial [Xanthobacteraceae bacterium]
MHLRPMLGLILCGVLLIGCGFAGPSQAVAQGFLIGKGKAPLRQTSGQPPAGGGAASGSSGGGAGVGGGGAGGGSTGGRGGVPPPGEQRFVADEVITAFSRRATPLVIDRIARQYDLTQLESQSFPLTGRTFYRWRIGGGRSVADVVRAIERERIVASAQPNYIFTLQEDAARVAAATHGDASQYVLGKLQVEQAHQVATGRNVRVALVDSEVDVKHPDLVGTTAKGFDALGGEENPDRHGTA